MWLCDAVFSERNDMFSTRQTAYIISLLQRSTLRSLLKDQRELSLKVPLTKHQ